jgi:asparagine synthase (glutamine-hydrolysing)
MSGIAGIAQAKRQQDVERMLNAIKHRGPAGKSILDLESDNVTLGIVWPKQQAAVEKVLHEKKTVRDSSGKGRLAEAQVKDGGIALSRDSLGAAPLYAGWTDDHIFCFASEVKALLEVCQKVVEVPLGTLLDIKHFNPPASQVPEPFLDDSPQKIADGIFAKIDQAVVNCLENGNVGCWLSGGMDSSVLCTIIRPHVKTLHSFSVGMKGSMDLAFAKQIADAKHTEHHELIVDQKQLVEIMPKVIYALESFDALLVRSSIPNYLVGKMAAEYVPAIFSGEAGDELFAGYDYLKNMELSELPNELLDIQGRLHNTAFQRVDRCSNGNGCISYLPFADPEVVGYARRIPPNLLIKDGISKWIIRHALRGKMPDKVLWRGKAKFWQGSGINDLFARIADGVIPDTEYEQEKQLPNGWTLKSKEELMYYRIFKERFGELKTLDWMGRTKETNGRRPKK